MLLGDSQRLQNFRRAFFHRNGVVARGAILGDSFLIGSRVTIVVAAEAAGIIRVTQIVRVSSPGDLQIGEHVAAVNCGQAAAGVVDVAQSLGEDIRILRAVEIA